MPTPSLLIVPARFKSGKLYSQIPTSGAGDFTVTRATAATRVNASGFIESVASGIPRLDYFASGGTVGCPALLVEASAQNLVPSGTTFNAETGVQYSGTTDSPAVAISGTLVTKNEASGTIRFPSQTCSTSALASSTTYVISRFFKHNGVDFTTTLEANTSSQWGGVGWSQSIILSAASGVTLGISTSCTGSVENFGNGWYRVSARITTGATITGAATVTYLMRLPAALSTGEGFLTACPQLETGSVATSYIPTTTASVTRNADVISVSGAVSGSIGQTEGTIYVEFEHTSNTAERRLIALSDGTATNRCFIWAQNNILYMQIRGSDKIIVNPIPTGYNKVAFAYEQNGASGNMYASLNGGAIVSGTSSDYFTADLNRVAIGNRESITAGLQWNNRIRAAALYTTRLTNAQLAALTTP